MFADFLLDSSWPHRSRRRWSTLASFAVQSVALASVLLFPLLYTTGQLPRPVFARIFGPSSLPALPAATHVHPASPSASHGAAIAPQSTLHATPQSAAPDLQVSILPAPDLTRLGIPGAGYDRISGNGVDHGVGSELNEVLPLRGRALRAARLVFLA